MFEYKLAWSDRNGRRWVDVNDVRLLVSEYILRENPTPEAKEALLAIDAALKIVAHDKRGVS